MQYIIKPLNCKIAKKIIQIFKHNKVKAKVLCLFKLLWPQSETFAKKLAELNLVALKLVRYNLIYSFSFFFVFSSI